MNEFYYCIGFGNDTKVPAEDILLSAASMWSQKKQCFIVPRLHDNVKSIFLDSGGYSFFTRFSEYPYSPDRYMKLVDKMCELYPVKHVAIMDYPCEPDTLGNNKIRRTFDNAKYLLSEYPAYDWVNVVQGYRLSEYHYCINLYRDNGLLTPLTAIGSICQRKGTKQLNEIIINLSGMLNDVHIHTFGLQIKSLASIHQYIHSSDSGAWKFGNICYYPNGLKEKIANYHRYKKKIDVILQQHNDNQDKNYSNTHY